jgi:hypothetical protein
MSPFFNALIAKYSPVFRYCARITYRIMSHITLM